MRNSLFLILSLFSWQQTIGQLSPASQKAQVLRQNVVSINTQNDVGFGFIVEAQADSLFIVTAAPVLALRNEMAQTAEIRFFNPNKRHTGSL